MQNRAILLQCDRPLTLGAGFFFMKWGYVYWWNYKFKCIFDHYFPSIQIVHGLKHKQQT